MEMVDKIKSFGMRGGPLLLSRHGNTGERLVQRGLKYIACHPMLGRGIVEIFDVNSLKRPGKWIKGMKNTGPAV